MKKEESKTKYNTWNLQNKITPKLKGENFEGQKEGGQRLKKKKLGYNKNLSPILFGDPTPRG